MPGTITSWLSVVVLAPLLGSCKDERHADPNADLPERITPANGKCGRCKANDPRAPSSVACAYTWRGACKHDVDQMCANYVPCDAACCEAKLGPGEARPTAIADAVRVDLENVCHALVRSGASAETDPSEKATKVAAWLTAHLETTEIKELMDSMAAMATTERPKVLRARAKAAGVDPCPFVDDP